MALLRSQAEKDNLFGLFSYPSFQIVEKTLEKVTNMCLVNDRLKRLLYYTDKHCLALPKLNQEQSLSLIGTNILIVPKLKVDPDTKPYIIFSLDDFVPEPGQTTFRSVLLSIDILCDYNHWTLDDFKLRPYCIAGELDSMIYKSFCSGIGRFVGARQLVLNEHLGGCTVIYSLETMLEDSAPIPNREVE